MNDDDDDKMDMEVASSSASRSLGSIKVYILQAKIDPELMGTLVDDAERAGMRLVGRPEDAEIIVTEVRMRKRLERHMDWEIARSKSLVTPAWLTSSVKAGYPLPCGDYVAVKNLADETARNCPDSPNCEGCSKCAARSRSASASDSLSAPSTPPPLPTFSPATGVSLAPDAGTWDLEAAKEKFGNAGLVEELRIMKQARDLEGEPRSALAYSRAIAAIKCLQLYYNYAELPLMVTNVLNDSFPAPNNCRKASGELTVCRYENRIEVGYQVADYLRAGHIPEAQTIATSPRFLALRELASVHGVGPMTARRLYELGLRNVNDLRNYYGIDVNEEPEDNDAQLLNDTANSKEQNDIGIKAALRVYDDINTPIPRAEVEEIARCAYAELCVIQEGCTYTITGGYRRGKPMSNDVDIVFTHPTPGVDRGLCKRLVQRLKARGMVTNVMHLSSFRAPNAMRKSQWDTLEKALTVFRLPPESKFCDGGKRRIHRRVDLIFAPVEVYWCAVIGWTGSTMFERDLRQWTKDKRGWKFDSSGMVKLSNSEPVLATSERHVFELCGLEWIDPTMRNAD